MSKKPFLLLNLVSKLTPARIRRRGQRSGGALRAMKLLRKLGQEGIK